MEEYLEIIKAFLTECNNDLDGEICLKCNGITTVAIKHLVEELEKYKRIKPVKLDGEYTLSAEEFLNVSDKLYELERNCIPKSVLENELIQIYPKYRECVIKTNFKELEPIDENTFNGLRLEAQKEIIQKILENN